MRINNMIVHHHASTYDIALPAGVTILNGIVVPQDTTVMSVRFAKDGDTLEESKKIQIFIRHLKEIYKVR